MAKFKVALKWEMEAVISVEASSMEDAMDLAIADIDAGNTSLVNTATDGKLVENTLEVDEYKTEDLNDDPDDPDDEDDEDDDDLDQSDEEDDE